MNIKSTSSQSTTGIPKALEAAIRRVLRPLVRLLLLFQITFPVFQQWLKQTYVEIADQEFPLLNKPQTDTRISLLTGIHRKDIKRLRHEESDCSETPENISIGVQLAAHWMGQSEYLDTDKKPLPLPFKAEQSQPSFERLVEQVCRKDIRARVVLDEWLRLGIVSYQDESGDKALITLSPGAFVPNDSIDEKAFFLGMNVADHLSAAAHNVIPSASPDKFERCVYYDGLSDSSIAELKEMVAEQGMALLQSLNEKALQLKQKDQSKSDKPTQRINVGVYSFDEIEQPSGHHHD